MYVARNVRLFSWFNFLWNFRLYSVVAIIYFAAVTGSYALGASIFSIAQLSQALFEVPTGVYSDRVGRSTALRMGALASVLSVVFYAIGHFYLVLVIGAVLEGLCRAFFSGNNDALLYETLAASGQKDTYHEAMGRVYSVLEFAGFIGASIAGFIAYESFSLLLWLSAVPQVLALIVSFQFIEPAPRSERMPSVYLHLKDALAHYKHNSRLRNLSLASVVGYGVGEATWSLQAAFYNTVLPVWAVGLFMSFNFLASTISYRVSGWMIDKFKALNLLIFQEVYSRILYVVALIRPTVASPALMASASVLYGTGEVAKSTLLQREFTDSQRATMASINSLAGNVFFAVFAVLVGFLADRVGLATSLLIAQVCLLPVLYTYIKLFRSRNSIKITNVLQPRG